MLRFDQPISGFTTWTAEGHGFGFSTASISERVRGRVKRAVLLAVLPRSDVEALIKKLATEVPIPHITYWIEPIEVFGQLTTTRVKHSLPIDAATLNTKTEDK